MCVPMTHKEWTFIRQQLASVSVHNEVDIEALRKKVIRNQELAERREFINKGKG